MNVFQSKFVPPQFRGFLLYYRHGYSWKCVGCSVQKQKNNNSDVQKLSEVYVGTVWASASTQQGHSQGTLIQM